MKQGQIFGEVHTLLDKPDMSLPTIGLVLATNTLDESHAAYPDVQNFIDLYEDDVKHIVIFGPTDADISRDSVEVVTVSRNPPTRTFFRILSYVWYQLKLAFELFRARNDVDSMFFHVGGTALLLPLLVCRLVGIPSNVFVLGSTTSCYYGTHGRDITSTVMVGFLTALEWTVSRLANRILVLSEGMDSPTDSGFMASTRVTANPNYISEDYLAEHRPVDQRPYDIIYVGRFEGVKGIRKLAHALTHLIECQPDVRIRLVGDGSLRDDVERILRDGGAHEQVELTGWVDHDEIPAHLAKSRLLVLPSESEGVPKTVLEAMACGTVPVATPVGGVPDAVTDGETGILLTDNDPATIARALDRTLDREDLDEMATHAQAYVRDAHSYEATVERFRTLLAVDSKATTGPASSQR